MCHKYARCNCILDQIRKNQISRYVQIHNHKTAKTITQRKKVLENAAIHKKRDVAAFASSNYILKFIAPYSPQLIHLRIFLSIKACVIQKGININNFQLIDAIKEFFLLVLLI